MTSLNHQVALCSKSLKYMFFIFQLMPRSGVDDLQSWTQIAPA